MTELNPDTVVLSHSDLDALLKDAARDALRAAATEARVRGDIGKTDEGGLDSWTFLEWRADQLEAGEVIETLSLVTVDSPAIERGARKLAAILDVDYDKAYVGYQASLKASVRAIIHELKAPATSTSLD